MRARFMFRAAVVLSLLPAAMPAQSIGRMLETDLRNFGGDVWAVWTSPFRGSLHDWMLAGATVGAAAAISPFDDDLDRVMLRNKNSGVWKPIEELREGGALYTGKYVAPAAGAIFIYSLATKNTKIQEGLFGCMAAYTSGSVARNYVLYKLIGRERPDSSKDGVDSPPSQQGDQYNFTFPGKEEWGMHSMPAGHAANVIACATYLTKRFEMGLFEPVLVAFATGTTVGRLVDRRHWGSDTMIGLVYGYAIGSLVAKRSFDRAERASGISGAAASTLSKTYFSPSKGGLTVGWRTTF